MVICQVGNGGDEPKTTKRSMGNREAEAGTGTWTSTLRGHRGSKSTASASIQLTTGRNSLPTTSLWLHSFRIPCLSNQHGRAQRCISDALATCLVRLPRPLTAYQIQHPPPMHAMPAWLQFVAPDLSYTTGWLINSTTGVSEKMG